MLKKVTYIKHSASGKIPIGTFKSRQVSRKNTKKAPEIRKKN